ncbi:MAG: TolC family protein [Polyangiales bacterium]
MRLLSRLLLVVLLVPSSRLDAQSKPTVGVAVVVDGPSPVFEQELGYLREEIRTQLSDRFEIVLVELPVEADWTADNVERQLEAAYSNPEVAVVLGFGHLTVRAVAVRRSLPKPTMLPFVVEAEHQGLARRGDVSGKKNLTYITEDFDISREAARLHEVAGSQHIIVLADRSEEGYLPSLLQGAQLPVVVADPTVEALISAIPKTADGVVITSIRRLSIPDRERLMALITQRRLPNVAVDPNWLEQGAMMSIRSPENALRRAQRAALNLDLIAEGRPASGIHVEFEEREELQINASAAAAVGIRPTFDILLEAQLVGEEAVEPEYQVSMEDVMLEAVDRNLNLLVSEKFVEAGEQRVKVDRGPLLPQGQLEAGAVVRDPDRVPVGGQIAQRQASAYARASQSIFSAEAWARFQSRKLLQEGREYGYFVDVLDVMLGAGSAYVSVLRAQAQERIQRRNAQLTREYLELARLRLEVGVANASELYRWQVTLAENQQSVVEARALIAQSKIDLNRVLNHPLEQPIAPLDLPDDQEGLAMAPDDPIAKYMRDPWSFEHLRDFMVGEGLRNSPAARQIEARKAAQERIKKGLVQGIGVPDFFVEGGVQYDFWRNGKGETTPPDFARLGFPDPDKFGWDVGLFLAVPLSRGGSGVAAVRESAILVERFAAEFDRVAQFIDTGVRTELYSAGAALMSVSLTREAARAAKKNLDLVVDLYRRGKVDIVRLVDAQTRSLVSNLAAANAVYDYMLSLLFVNREMSHFRNLDTPEAEQDFDRRLNEFMLRQQGQ